jgi:hypothetical protein
MSQTSLGARRSLVALLGFQIVIFYVNKESTALSANGSEE